MGYRLEEIQGKHHSLFVDPELARSAEYRDFWARLGRGEYDAGQYRRFGKGQREIWIQASYNPVLDRQGRPYKVVKFATDITAQKLQAADSAGQLAAITKSQAVIEFSMDGRILSADDNFLAATGYSLDEVRGQHHSLFVEPEHRSSIEYRQFWENWGAANMTPASIGVLAKAGVRSGSRRPTTRSWTSMASRSRSSSTPPTSPRRCMKTRPCSARWRRPARWWPRPSRAI